MAESLSRLIYVDDSGRQQSGLVVFGWVEFAPEDWASVLDGWLEARKRLRREFGIVADRELHSTDYINGRGRITDRPPARFTHQGQVYWRDLGQAAAVMLLKELSSMRGLTVGSVYRSLDPDPTGHDKVEVYRSLVQRWENELRQRSELAMVMIDGDGSDGGYRTVHRGLTLRNRRIIEDAVMIDSAHSQLVQMADLVAWCAYVAVNRYVGHEFAWDWYAEYLAVRDPHRAPQQI